MKMKDITNEANHQEIYQQILQRAGVKQKGADKGPTAGQTFKQHVTDPVAQDIKHRAAKAMGSYGTETPKAALAQGAARGLQWMGRSIAGVKDTDPGPVSLSKSWRKATGAADYDYHRVELTPDELRALKAAKKR
jgi:hypothetical protein